MKYFVMDPPPLPNVEILFKILSLPNIAKVMTYYSAWRVCGPYSVKVRMRGKMRMKMKKRLRLRLRVRWHLLLPWRTLYSPPHSVCPDHPARRGAPWPLLRRKGVNSFIKGLTSSRGSTPSLREAIFQEKQFKYGHCPNWLDPTLPPLFWAVTEHFYE